MLIFLRSWWRFSSAGLAIVLSASGYLSHAQKLPPGCRLPFAEIAGEHKIDTTCGFGGDAEAGPHQEQNKAKNNFCAGQGRAPIPVQYKTFIDLQKAAQKMKDSGKLPFGSSKSLPKDRKILEEMLSAGGSKIGEGSVVRVVAFVIDARNSGKESVNCGQTGNENNDIHIDLGMKSSDDACKSITAEMSPHFRPLTWARITNKRVHHDLIQHPVRVTGHLFFDASHAPCRNGTRPFPNRASIWEIHPVYAFDVCRNGTLGTCGAGDESVWTPLDKWVEKFEKSAEEEP